MRRTMAKAAFHTALNLLFFAVIGTGLLALTYKMTHDTIAISEENEKLKLISQIAPTYTYDNKIMQDTVRVAADELLGTDEATIIYRGRMHGKASIAVLQAVAPDGYGGKIILIIAIHANEKIGGVRVVSHKETPGLGDYIEIAKDGWIDIFKGASLQSIIEKDWKVRKDGGTFEYRAGATITPRAVLKAVRKVLQYFALHQEELFAEVPLAFLEKAGQAKIKGAI